MRTKQQDPDVLGHMLLDTAADLEVWEIMEREDGFVSARSAEIYFDDYDHWPDIEQAAMRLAQGRVLDFGCRAGKHSLYLQNHGHEVLAIDSSRGAVIAARHLGVRKALIASLKELPVESIPFDTILMLGSFPFLGSTTRLKTTLAHLFGITTAEGTILATVNANGQTGKLRPFHSSWMNRSGYQWESRIRIRYRKFVSRWIDYLVLSPSRLAEVIQDTGWELQDTIAGDGCYLAVMQKVKNWPNGVFHGAPPAKL